MGELRAPFLSEYDPSVEGEGSIDPLGLQPSYERLADRLLPAVTVRMGRPRFVTAMAVGAHVCRDWEPDSYAADGVTPPWLVFEWFVVEAFVRNWEVLRDGHRIPGIQKVEAALRDQRPVSASSYLKTPTVFGFSGVFRRLVRHLRVLHDSGTLEDAGYELLAAWAADQRLDGFLDARDGKGAEFRERLIRAVRQGMERGRTTPQNREFWRELAIRLDPGRAGKAERGVLLQLIESRSGEPEIIRQIVACLRAEGRALAFEDEAQFLRQLRKGATVDLAERVSAIGAYESLCRPITDAFDWARHLSTKANGALLGIEDLANCKALPALFAALRGALDAVSKHPRLTQWEPGLLEVVARFKEVVRTNDLFRCVLEHHEIVQHGKPPDGKRPWFERGSEGRILVRPGYALPEPPLDRPPHVHEYRIPTFSGFLVDLGSLK